MQRVRSARVALLSLGAVGVLGARLEGAARAEEGAKEEGPEGIVQEVFLGSIAFPQEAKELQLSAASSWRKIEDGQVLDPVLVAEYGFTDRLQIEAEAPFMIAMPGEGDTDGGLGNVEVGLLYNFLRSSELGLVFSGTVFGVAPTASTELMERAYGGGAELAVYKLMGPIHANLSAGGGAEMATEEDSELEYAGEAALSFLLPLGSVIPIVEVGVEHEGENELRFAGGLSWLATHSIEIGLAGLVSRGEEETEWGGIANVTWEGSLAGEGE